MTFLINSYRYLAANATLSAASGTFTLTGVSAAFLHGLSLPASAGSFALTGTAAALQRALKMAAGAGAFSLTGQDVEFSSGNPDLEADTGTFTLTGNAVALTRALKMDAASGSFALTGNAAALKRALSVLAAGGTFALTGVSAAFARALVVSAVKGTFTLTGNAATLTHGAGSDPNWSSVVLLCGFNGTDAATSSSDESSAAHSLTFNGNAQLDTAQFKFGASSLLCDGTGDSVSTPDSADWFLSTGQFTIECFVRWNSITLGNTYFFLTQSGGTLGTEAFALRFTNSQLSFRRRVGATNPDLLTAWTPTTGTWYHVAVDRDGGGIIRTYVDGVMFGKVTDAGSISDFAQSLFIGAGAASANSINGWLDEVRITKGVARYASDSGYTVPTAAFPRS